MSHPANLTQVIVINESGDVPSPAPATSEKRKRVSKEDDPRRTWTNDETNHLLEIWLNHRDALEGTGPMSSTFITMKGQLKDRGVNRDELQIQRKIQNMRRCYREYKKQKTGAEAKDFEFKEQMDAIFANSHYMNPELVTIIESSNESSFPSHDTHLTANEKDLPETNLPRTNLPDSSVSKVKEIMSKKKVSIADVYKTSQEMLENAKEMTREVKKSNANCDKALQLLQKLLEKN